MAKIGITGMGIVSAIGMSVDENLRSLLKAQHGISPLQGITSRHQNKLLVGEIKHSNESLENLLNLKSNHGFSRTSMLGTLAVLEALRNAEIDPNNDASLGFVNSTSVGGMDMTEQIFFSSLENDGEKRFADLQNTGVNTTNMANYLGIKGLTTTISTACSSAANAIILGARLIQTGRLDRVVVGGTDALSKFTINGFSTLMILSDELNQPFDNNRKGLNLGEGAAYLILESDKSIKARNKTPLAYLTGYSNANDAFHQTASSEHGDGAFLAINLALEKANLSAEDIDYINVHGTATANNDLSEGRALIRVFGDKVPKFSSTKPFTGHTLAAAASIEAVFSILALQNQIIFPNLNFSENMAEFVLTPVVELQNHKMSHVLSNSFGFGGNCSALIFSK